MSITAERKAELIQEHAREKGDTGSPEVQVAILTDRINTLTGHWTRDIAFSADGEKLATLSAGWDARLWDLDLHEQTLSVLRGAHGEKIPCSSLAFSPAETVISMPSLADQVMLYEPGSGRPQSVLKSSGGLILSMAFSPDGRSLAAGTRTGWVEIWNLATGERRSLDHRHTGAIWGLVFSPDGRTLATAGDRTVKVNEADAGPHPLSSASHD